MLRRSATAVLAVCAAVAASGAQAQKMPPGAYLRKPVNSGSEISSQVKSDAKVAERYSRVFHLSPDTIGKAVGKMKLTRLRQDHVLRVYYVHSGERLGYKVRRVAAGTPVFVASDGTPAFVQACGNPLKPETGMSASLTGGAVKKFSVNEPVNATPMTADLAQVAPAPVIDADGRVIAEGISYASEGSSPVISVFTDDADAADKSVAISAPQGAEEASLVDWIHGGGSRLANIVPQPGPAPSAPGAHGPVNVVSVNGLASGGGGGYIPGLTWGIPSAPSGPFVPGISSSLGAASTPEPGAMTLLGGAIFAAAGAFARRKRQPAA